MTRLAATLTIGQAPRPDITPILAAHWPEGGACRHVGLLDGLSRTEIDARYGPRPGDGLLITRLVDGTSATLGKRAVAEGFQRTIDDLEAQGYELIILLCTGDFAHLSCRRAWLVEPDRVVPSVAAALAQTRQVGIVVSLIEQADSEAAKWAPLAKPPIYEAAAPYDADLEALARAARSLADRGAQMLVLDCMGFTERHRACAAEASGLPVVLSNAVIARLLPELVQPS